MNTPAAATNAEAANGAHQFATCDEARAAGKHDIQRSDAAYAEHLDRDMMAWLAKVTAAMASRVAHPR